MSKHLENLAWQPAWLSHLGCIKGCLDYLKLPVSTAWLYGGTGHAFILNMDPTGCPSSPTAMRTEMLFNLGNNLGYTINGIAATRSQPDFTNKQLAAWEFAQSSIDRGIPCYGWELDIPEFYVVYGYDDQGYLYSGPTSHEGSRSKPWVELGQTEIGCLELYAVQPGYMTDDTTVVKEALEFALDHATSPTKWIYPGYKAGLEAYDNWIQAVQSQVATMMGLGYNAAVWSECRHYAVAFLDEAAERIGGSLAPLLMDARVHYQVVADRLKDLCALYPFPVSPSATNNPEIQSQSVAILQAARGAEAEGLKALAKVVDFIKRA